MYNTQQAIRSHWYLLKALTKKSIAHNAVASHLNTLELSMWRNQSRAADAFHKTHESQCSCTCFYTGRRRGSLLGLFFALWTLWIVAFEINSIYIYFHHVGLGFVFKCVYTAQMKQLTDVRLKQQSHPTRHDGKITSQFQNLMRLLSTEVNGKDCHIICMKNWTLAYVLHVIWKRLIYMQIWDWVGFISVCSLGIKSRTFSVPMQCSNHSATETIRNLYCLFFD